MPAYLKPKPNITGEDFMTTLLSLSTKAPTAATRPEIELLFCCARTHIDSEIAERIRTLLQQDIDWAYLIQTAAQHGIIPLLYQSLNTTCPEAVPKVNLAQLRNYFHTNAQHNLFLTKELLKLLTLFKANGITVIPYKGPVLAVAVYGNLALRQFCDLDILVHKRDVLRAKDLLISQGYRTFSLTLAQSAMHLQSENEEGFKHHKTEVSVDLHWAITRRYFCFPIEIETLWERLEPVSLAGTTVFNFSPEDLLLILCMHGAAHRWERLGWICDVAQLISVHQRLNWEWVMEQAKTLNSVRVIFLGLFLVNDLFGTLLPEEVLLLMQTDPVAKALATQVQKRLFYNSDETSSLFERSLFHIKMRERLQERIKYCLFVMTPNVRDLLFVPLPIYLSFLYYLVRPIRLFGKYGLSSLKRYLG